MTLAYDHASNRFIFYPAQACSTAQGRSPTPKARNPFVFRSPAIPNPQLVAPAKASKGVSAIFLKPFNLILLAGWFGIAVYYFYYPVRLSLAGVIFYLGLDLIGLVIFNLIAYRYASEQKDILRADLRQRGIFWREVRRKIAKYISVPSLCFGSDRQFDYAQINLAADLKGLRDRKRKNTINIFATDSKASGSRLSFLVEIPAEDGLCLVPPALIGINALTSLGFGFIFAFLHFHKYSAVNCLRLMLQEVLIILVILPQYGLLTCIVGHLFFDLLLPTDTIFKMRQSVKLRSNSSRRTRNP
ncbi:MAG: hypothetical protein KME35_05610 [Aphanocapsa sp. GSE-SYN-MK-11-07L]|jgi:hypothetical protein|nr:hypothetical protein [Aphanocapsa sp. GSE-SYN-MK-11-07L]